MKAYKTFCFDLDGTIYRGDEPIPESIVFLQSLQDAGIDPYFVTNNSSKTPAGQVQKLEHFGFKTNEQHIMTSAVAAAKYCAQHHREKTVQMIGEVGLREALQQEGLSLVDDNGDIVIMGIDHDITYD